MINVHHLNELLNLNESSLETRNCYKMFQLTFDWFTISFDTLYCYIPGLVKARSFPFLSERLTDVSKKSKWKSENCGISSDLDAFVNYQSFSQEIDCNEMHRIAPRSFSHKSHSNICQWNETYV